MVPQLSRALLINQNDGLHRPDPRGQEKQEQGVGL